MTRLAAQRARLASVALVALMVAGAAGEEAHARRPNAKPNGSYFFGWKIEARTLSGLSRATTLIVVVRDASEAEPPVAKVAARRYRMTARVVGGRRVVARGDRLVVALRDQEERIEVDVFDRWGARWTRTVKPDRAAETTITLVSQWTPPIYSGRMANLTNRCPPAERRTLRFQVKASDELPIGDYVKVAPGRSAKGPVLPDGTYVVDIEAYERGRWVAQPPAELVVAAAVYRFEATCPAGPGTAPSE